MPSLASELLTRDNLGHAISGSIGGVAALSLFFPLNTVRLLLQVDDSLKAEGVLLIAHRICVRDGFSTLYRGWWSNVVCLGTSNFVFFYAYNALQVLYRSKANLAKRVGISSGVNLAIASLAGVINVLITAPLWLAGTRLSVQQKNGHNKNASCDHVPYRGIIHCLSSVAKDEGVHGLWKGTGPSLMLVSVPTIQFVTYERLKAISARLARAKRSTVRPAEFFIMGAIAKLSATLCTYPLQVAQSKLRAHGRPPDECKHASNRSTTAYSGTLDCLIKLARKDGLWSWYKGMSAKLWQTVLMAAFQLLTYEQMQTIVLRLLAGGVGRKITS